MILPDRSLKFNRLNQDQIRLRAINNDSKHKRFTNHLILIANLVCYNL
jgi:hypothetical protein